MGLLAIFWPFFDQFGQNIFLRQKLLFGPFLGPENNYSPYFGHFLTNLAKNILGQKPLFGPFLGLENNFLPYFGHFLTNLAKKKFWPKTTIWTLFRPRNQLFTIFRPFFDQFGQKKFLGQKPLFGPFLGLKNNFSPYFGHFWPILPKKISWPKTTIWTLFRPRKQLFAIIWPFFDQFGWNFFLGQKPLFGPFLDPEINFSPYFGHFLTNLVKKKFGAENHFLDPF